VRRTSGKHVASRPATRATTLARATVPAGAVAVLALTMSGSVGAATATANPAAISSALSARAAAIVTASDTPYFADVRAESAIANREQSAIRAQRAEQEREALAERKAKAKAAAKKKAKAKALAHRWVSPVKNPNLTSSFGHRWGRLHAGLDFGAVVGTPLRAMSSGTVTKAGWGGGYGMKVEIRYWDGTVSYYAHMSSIAVAEGQHVTPGMLVGKTGNTGNSTGPHLHLEIHPAGGDPVDPKPWLTKQGLKF